MLWQSLKFLFIFAFSSSVWAEVRFEDTRLWRRARPLSSGQQVFSFLSSYQNNSDHFSADGRVEPIGDQYSRTLTWDQLFSANQGARADLQDYMRQNGMTDSDVAAVSTYEVSRQEVGFGLNWAYGLMDNWMIGFSVPIRFTTTRVQQFVTINHGFPKTALPRPKLAGKDLSNEVRKAAEQELSNSGYDQVPSQKQAWEIGDVSLLSQQAILETYHWVWGVQQTVKFPTSQNRSVGDYIPQSRDEGAVDLGISTLIDYQAKKSVTGVRVGFVAQLPDTARRRSPSTTQGKPVVDPKVNRNLGDWVWAAFDTEYHVTRKLDFSAQYSYLAKAQDRYSGDKFTDAEYAAMGENTDQQMHQTRVGLLYRIGTSGSRSGVSHKWQASVDYTYPWSGRNASDAATTSVELINYF